MQFSITVNKTFMEDIKTVCREFDKQKKIRQEQAAERMGVRSPRRPKSDNSELSDVPDYVFDDEDNNELKGAAPERLLYSDTIEEKDQLWIYFTLIGGGDSYAITGSNRMLTFYSLKIAQSGGGSVRPAKIKDVTLASQPFRLAVDPFQVLAIAKYLFVKRGVDETLKVPIYCQDSKVDLLTACKRYQDAHARQQAAKQTRAAAAAGTYRGTTPREQSTAAPSRRQTYQMSHQSSLPKSPSLTPSVHNNSRKRDRSLGQRAETAQPPLDYTPSPSPTRDKESTSPLRLDDQERDKLVTENIELQAQEEEVDGSIEGNEAQRSKIKAQISNLQAGLEDETEIKATLMEDKERIKAEKKRLQSLLDSDERLESGYEAGRRSVESKRQRLE